ncbi:hypothetical protein HELRODRAFT_62415 [Helobdella robusta]|uniref:glutathione transferase n=1 Tax=Helobdella robusta TaxID=6412 RepID=T1FX02_HELRO|nr:hypothetical protein HELRODRAFT_62415 [Helobdella robusta]ESO13224.1 hypothetical protein HELRODRAFT_62415 [Helobdella robusta]
MPNYKLVYFDGRGRAETIRLAFAVTGIAYEDHRIKKEEWPEMKPKTFAGYLPYMEVDGTVLFESLAMAKYVAREGGLQPACSLSQAQCDATLDVVNGFLEKASATKHTSDAGARVGEI